MQTSMSYAGYKLGHNSTLKVCKYAFTSELAAKVACICHTSNALLLSSSVTDELERQK